MPREYKDIAYGVENYWRKHYSIDYSLPYVGCKAGSCHITLTEYRWWASPINRADLTLTSGQEWKTRVIEGIGWFDVDHELSVRATKDGTKCDVFFTSQDF